MIRDLKKKQLVGDAILPHYQQRLKQLESIIARAQAGHAADAARPDPDRHRRRERAAAGAQHAPPRLVDNRGEQGEFVLPLNIPSADPSKAKQYDDFTFEAASWTLTAHEARPGHELQFAAMVEHGVSQARAIFAFNSTNVEGWGLYAEYIVKPFMPREGQLISLQHRLLRAARAFSDPELQLGRTTPERVKQLLMEDVVLSDAMATQEVERYTFRAPGPGHQLLLWLFAAAAAPERRRTRWARGSTPSVPRLRARAGPAAPAAAPESGDAGIRQVGVRPAPTPWGLTPV